MIDDPTMDPALREAALLLATAPPPVTPAVAEKALRDHYDLDGTVRDLVSERDRNFLVELADGGRRVLKFYNDRDDAETRDFQHGALRHMARGGARCRVPVLISTRDGAPECVVEAQGRPQPGILISFVPGEPAQGRWPSPAYRRNLGRAAAEVDRALAGFDHPKARRILLWDHMRVGHMRPVAETLDESQRRAWILAFLDRFTGDIAPRAAQLRWQVIHNDLTGTNVFVDPAAPDTISGVVDFGDVVHAPLVNDVAVTATYVMPEGTDPIEALGDVLAGYDAVSPLREEEAALVYDLMTARIVLRVLLYHWRGALFPENLDYILRNHAAGWRLVDWFAGRDPVAGRDAVLAQWAKARSIR